MDEPLAGSSAKVKRAAAHLEALHKEVRAFHGLEPRPYRFVSTVDVGTSRYLTRVRIERELPLEWSLIVGDFVHNLRSALDHMVWQLVLANNAEPKRGATAFPIFDERPPETRRNHGRQRWERAVAGVSPRARSLIEGCQPYREPDGPDAHLLSALRELSNEDKHRLVLASFGAIERPPQAPAFDVVGVRDVASIEKGQLYVEHALRDNDLVLEAPVEITGPNPEVKVKGELPLDVGFGDPIVPLKGLRKMIEVVANVVAEGRRLLT